MTTTSFGAINELGVAVTVQLESWPDTCPICRVAIEPNYVYSYTRGFNLLSVVYRCPRLACQMLFISYFDLLSNKKWRYLRSFPESAEKISHPDSVEKISPDFVEIYAQASDADRRGSKRIAGTGFRKALEFLIKDYLINKLSEDTEAIKRTPLGTCINNYVDDGRIKAVAKRAAWLGNDETHYERLWEEKDIKDLRTLITLTVHWIALELDTEALLLDMPDKN